MIEVLGHRFTNHKESEMICWTCGYVIWRCTTEDDAREAIEQIDGHHVHCGGAWHVFTRTEIPA